MKGLEEIDVSRFGNFYVLSLDTRCSVYVVFANRDLQDLVLRPSAHVDWDEMRWDERIGEKEREWEKECVVKQDIEDDIKWVK